MSLRDKKEELIMLVPSIFENNFVEDLFRDMFDVPAAFKRDYGNRTAMMNSDVKEFEDGYQVDMELPGFKKEDIQAELKDGYLTINASRNEDKEEKNDDGRYIRRERYCGKCQRSFYVGEGVTQEDIKASFENGILKLNIPKKVKMPEVEEKKYIAIEG